MCFNEGKMAKTEALSLRVSEDLKKALQKAASDDDRTIAQYVERVLSRHLREAGYLQSPSD